MNFFERQEVARQNTTYLVTLFALAVVSIVAGTSVVVAVAVHFLAPYYFEPTSFSWWAYREVLFAAGLGSMAVIGIGTFYKWLKLGNSGMAVAQYMGGTLINQNTQDPKERVLINIVEEMAIASGIPVPLIFVIQGEPGINAFAAGTTTKDAVVGVTSGALASLSRDELQGVVAHEFSHIFNGDCRLNMRLLSYLAGIVSIGLLGRALLRGLGGRRRGSRSDGKGAAALLGLGLTLFCIGYLGVFIGRLIRAAVSRQREFLADACAVQFTRNPSGIAGALAKISEGSAQVSHGHAEETSHMFFDNPIRSFVFFSRALATHPPLKERIAAIDKSFLKSDFLPTTGSYPEHISAANIHEKFTKNNYTKKILAEIGTLTNEGLGQASLLIAGLSPLIRSSHHDPEMAQAIVLGLLMRDSDDNRDPKALIKSLLGENIARLVERSLSELKNLLIEQHLATFELCAPALRTLAPYQQERLLKTAQYIVRVDQQIDIMEASYLLLLQQTLTANKKQKSARSHSLARSSDSINNVIAAMAYHGHETDEMAQRAFAAASYKIWDKPIKIPPRDFCDGRSLIRSVEVVSHCPPSVKKLVIEACYFCVQHDELVAYQEVELLRALSSCLDAPIPLMTVPDK